MFRRKKKVQPFVDEYISRLYEDTAVLIYVDLRSGKGLQNHYAAWLESKLQDFPEPLRNKYSLLRAPPARKRAWSEGTEASSSRATEREATGPETRRTVERSNEETGRVRRVVHFEERSAREIKVSSVAPTEQHQAGGERPGDGSNANSKFCVVL